MPRKTDAQLRKEIELYWPGGTGGGGSRRGGSKAGAVVKPHARTSTQCTRCSQYHTTEEHDRHAHGRVRPMAKKGKAKSKPKTSARPRSKSKKTAKPRAKTANPRKKSATRPRGPRKLSDAQMVSIVHRAVSAAPKRDRHDQGVYVSSVWNKVGKQFGMTLEEFKRWLVRRNAEQMLTLLRVDLVDTADPNKVEKSYIYDMGAVFDLIRDPEHRDLFS